MSEHFKSLLEQSLQLDQQERWALVKAILDHSESGEGHIDASETFELSEAQKEELDRRTALRKAGKQNTYSWEEVKQGLYNR